MNNPFGEDLDQISHRSASKWPLWTLVVLSVAAFIVSLFNLPRVSITVFLILVVASFILLLTYRLSLASLTREMDADASVVNIGIAEKLVILASAIGCLANGIVIGLEVGSWEMWF